MLFSEVLLSERWESTLRLIGSYDRNAKMLRGGGQALVGVVHRGNRVFPCYSIDLLRTLGMTDDQRRNLTEICFLETPFMTLDLAGIAMMSAIERVEGVELNRKVDIRERSEKIDEVVQQFRDIMRICAINGINLGAEVGVYLTNMRAEAENEPQND